jgi:hypothetical protein
VIRRGGHLRTLLGAQAVAVAENQSRSVRSRWVWRRPARPRLRDRDAEHRTSRGVIEDATAITPPGHDRTVPLSLGHALRRPTRPAASTRPRRGGGSPWATGPRRASRSPSEPEGIEHRRVAIPRYERRAGWRRWRRRPPRAPPPRRCRARRAPAKSWRPREIELRHLPGRLHGSPSVSLPIPKWSSACATALDPGNVVTSSTRASSRSR